MIDDLTGSGLLAEEKEVLFGGASPAMKALLSGTEKKKTPMQQHLLSLKEQEDLCEDILRNARTELYMSMRFLDIALSSFKFTPSAEGPVFATDGYRLLYHPEKLLAIFYESRIPVNRAYMHMLLHCLFCHPDGRGNRAKEYWDLACDIAVESILDRLPHRCVHVQPKMFRADVYQRLKAMRPVLNAESIYQDLQEMELSEKQYERLVLEFFVDDHRIWEENEGPKAEMPNRKKDWDEKREKMQAEMEYVGKEAAEEARDLLNAVRMENRERYDYRRFLRQFSVMKETLRVDTDSFDYIYYNYGMEMYGNMPLIEHLETKEEKRIEDFVIVIDTSLSCSGDLVRRFLSQTYEVLSAQESFFRKIHVHILQCDEKVQSDTLITNGQELAEYMDHLEIRGLGGTDFRPAFAYVDRLLSAGEFTKLKGLIYFTDGYGIYPVQMPSYDTAFVFLKDDYSDIEVPSWAIKLILDPEDLKGEHCRNEYKKSER